MLCRPVISTPKTTQITTKATVSRKKHMAHAPTYIQSILRGQLPRILAVLDLDRSESCCVVAVNNRPENTSIATRSTTKAPINRKKPDVPPLPMSKRFRADCRGSWPLLMAIEATFVSLLLTFPHTKPATSQQNAQQNAQQKQQ